MSFIESERVNERFKPQQYLLDGIPTPVSSTVVRMADY
jgi:hypothetical protein